MWRAALRSGLAAVAVTLVAGALSPHREPPPPPAAQPYPLQYVATCCARPVYIQELKR